MILDTTSKSLQIILGEAKTTSDCDITASWGAITTTAFTPTENDTVSNGTSAVTVVAAPAASTQLDVKEIRLHNNDTVPHNVTLRLDNGGTFRTVVKQLIPAGGDFLYTPLTPPTTAIQNTRQTAQSGTVTLTSGTNQDFVTLSLLPGDWLVFGLAAYTFSAGATSDVEAWIGTVSITPPTPPCQGYAAVIGAGAAFNDNFMPTGAVFMSLATTTTVYMSGRVNGSGVSGTCKAQIDAVPVT